MKVLQVVPRIADQSSGPSYSVKRLCEALQQAGAEVALHVLEPLPQDLPQGAMQAYPTGRFPGAWRLGWSPAMRQGLLEAARGADVIHNHSLWMMPNIYCHEAARVNGTKLVFSPRGTLSVWARRRSRLRKQVVWRLGQKAALFGADCLHATSEREAEDIRRIGLQKPVVTLPNGVDIPELSTKPVGRDKSLKLLFLSRIHPAKNVARLLKVWATLEPRYPDWHLDIAGPLIGSYPQRMQKLAEDLGLQRVNFLGEVKGAGKSAVLARADLFVLPTHSENFGLAVAESLAHGTPVIVTRGAPWAGVEQHGCGWWIEPGAEALEAALGRAMSGTGTELAAMGAQGRAWMEREFSWPRIGEQMLGAYAALLDHSVPAADIEWAEPL
jgi:glycosyltransferase involved in cell wall biosynthesis